jgi:hypothetical protein
MRKLVMELIQPTIKRSFEDHETVITLTNGLEKLKKKVEDNEVAFAK